MEFEPGFDLVRTFRELTDKFFFLVSKKQEQVTEAYGVLYLEIFRLNHRIDKIRAKACVEMSVAVHKSSQGAGINVVVLLC